MARRLTIAMLIVALVLQPLVAAQAKAASDVAQSAQQPAPCAHDMPEHTPDCPCCPDDVKTAAGCLSLCAAAFATALPVALMDAQSAARLEPVSDQSFLSRTYAPPDPPPIV